MDIVTTIGWFIIKKSLDNVYNGAYEGAYNVIFDSSTSKLEHKLDKILEQNKQLQKEIIILKGSANDRQILLDHDLKNYDIVIVQDYVDMIY